MDYQYRMTNKGIGCMTMILFTILFWITFIVGCMELYKILK